ncbi:hypothetical protein BWI15_20125 [Kribbella sp. ALI-6-A]|uniref:hypothetical protein n=1 Tax=Kribbella sp. ALI-6-A TaxID=1933817 RepID=UPI00097CB191|nr:hypothetical protein [Kribbella sp. ALI-6-A]ONI72350.1 hypothetical protein BWI15_20125 [Kribbella sp. ALI-6-A]
MPSQSLRSDAVDVVRTVSFPLLLVVTGIGLLLMPRLVGADWPGYSLAMILVVLVALPATFTLTLLSLKPSRFARWITVLAIGACVIRVVWSLYDAGERATYAAIALAPFLLILGIAVVLLAYSWPKATTRELAEAARRNGWQVFREFPDGRRAAARPVVSGVYGEVPRSSSIPSGAEGSTAPQPGAGDTRALQPGVDGTGMLTLPSTPLPLPIGRRPVVRNVVLADQGLAFEARWLEWHGIVCRRRRLAVFVGRPLERELPALEVRPGRGLTRSDLSLESAEFNRSYDVIGEDARYLMAMLQPRVMQALLDSNPIGLVVDGDALVAYTERRLDVGTLTRGMTLIARLNGLIPQHVYGQWGGSKPSPTSKLRFAGRGTALTIGKVLLRCLALSTGLLGLALAACLAAAAAEAQATNTPFTPPRSLSSLLIAIAVLAGLCTAAGLASRPRSAHGSASA